VDLKAELTEVKELLRAVLEVVPVQREFVELKDRLGGEREAIVKLEAVERFVREMHTDWQAATNRVIQSFAETRQEKVEFARIYTEVLGKEMQLIADIRQGMLANDERFLRGVAALAGRIERIETPSWSERAKQYGVQVAITVGILAMILGVYHLVWLVVRFFN
jgi:hypothetical protein